MSQAPLPAVDESSAEMPAASAAPHTHANEADTAGLEENCKGAGNDTATDGNAGERGRKGTAAAAAKNLFGRAGVGGWAMCPITKVHPFARCFAVNTQVLSRTSRVTVLDRCNVFWQI